MSRVLLKMVTPFFAAVVALLLMPLGSQAMPVPQEQQQQESQQPPPPPDSAQPPVQPTPTTDQPVPKKRKVWTNDDVVQLRTPADEYLAEKEAREAAEAAEAKHRAEAKPEKTATPPSMTMPETVEETQVQLEKREKQVLHDQGTLDYLKSESPPAEQQAEKQKEIDTMTAVLEKTRKEIKALRDNLERLRKVPAPEKPSSPPTASPNW